jgi:hypothetical protein
MRFLRAIVRRYGDELIVATDEVAAALIAVAGGYLRNVVREQRVICRVCAAPVNGFDRCWHCSREAASPSWPTSWRR